MPFYQIKVRIHKKNNDEFVRAINSLMSGFIKYNGCAAYSLYQDIENESEFCIIGEYRTSQAMRNHFQTRNFEVLVGAVTVLGKSFEITTVDAMKSGGFELAKTLLGKQKTQ